MSSIPPTGGKLSKQPQIDHGKPNQMTVEARVNTIARLQINREFSSDNDDCNVSSVKIITNLIKQ